MVIRKTNPFLPSPQALEKKKRRAEQLEYLSKVQSAGPRYETTASPTLDGYESEGCPLMEPPEEIECDVVIVGGGPAGCSCALYTSRANLKTVMLDKNSAVGALAITSHIANYPYGCSRLEPATPSVPCAAAHQVISLSLHSGVDGTVTGNELLDKMRNQAIHYGTEYRRAQVFLVDLDGNRKSVYTAQATFHARALVLATGAMGRPPSYKGEGELLGEGVSYCATCDGAFYVRLRCPQPLVPPPRLPPLCSPGCASRRSAIERSP